MNIASWSLWLQVPCIQGRGSYSPTSSPGSAPFHCETLPWSLSVQSRRWRQLLDPEKESGSVFMGSIPCCPQASVSMWVRAGCNLRPRIKLPPGWVLLISVNLSEATLDKPGGGVGVDATGSLERRSIPGLEIRALGGPKEARACSLRPHTPLRCSAWHLRFDASQTYDQCLSSPVREMEK